MLGKGVLQSGKLLIITGGIWQGKMPATVALLLPDNWQSAQQDIRIGIDFGTQAWTLFGSYLCPSNGGEIMPNLPPQGVGGMHWMEPPCPVCLLQACHLAPQL